MRSSLFSRIRTFCKKHDTRLALTLLLIILSMMSFCICIKPAAGDLLATEWATRYLFPVVALISIVLSIFRKYILSLALFIGYHAGIFLAVLGVDRGAEHLGSARLVILLTFAIFAILGVWGELFDQFLLRKRKANQAEDCKFPTDSSETR